MAGIVPAAGGVPVDPWSAGFMALASVAGQTMKPAGPSMAIGGTINQAFDNSGWTVATGKGTASASRTQATSAGSLLPAIAANPTALMVLALVGIVAWKHLRK